MVETLVRKATPEEIEQTRADYGRLLAARTPAHRALDRGWVAWYAETDPLEWQVITPQDARGWRCRMKGCAAEPVAALLRTHHYRSGVRKVAWRYCADHLYGRIVEDGRVLIQRIVFPESPDCRAAKHAACSTDAWDEIHDQPAPCTCHCHPEDW